MNSPLFSPDELEGVEYEAPKTSAEKFLHQMEDAAGVKKFVFDSSSANNLEGLPAEAAALMSQMMGQPVKEDPNAGSDLVRKRPEMLEKAIKEAQKPRDRFEIDIENSSVLDLYVKKNNKDNVRETLNTLSKINYEENKAEPIYYYSDLGINFYFDENEIISEIEVDEKYNHPTTKGLKMGDSLDKAVELYGKPRMKSARGAIWDKFSILLQGKEINVVRIKIRG